MGLLWPHWHDQRPTAKNVKLPASQAVAHFATVRPPSIDMRSQPVSGPPRKQPTYETPLPSGTLVTWSMLKLPNDAAERTGCAAAFCASGTPPPEGATLHTPLASVVDANTSAIWLQTGALLTSLPVVWPAVWPVVPQPVHSAGSAFSRRLVSSLPQRH